MVHSVDLISLHEKEKEKGASELFLGLVQCDLFVLNAVCKWFDIEQA